MDARFERFLQILYGEDRLLTEAEEHELRALADEYAAAHPLPPDFNVRSEASQLLVKSHDLLCFWTSITKPGINRLEQVKQVHKCCVAAILSLFEVPVGEAGIGVAPKGFKL